MALEPYKDRAWLYEHYVTKRMNLKDIAKRLEQSHNISITQQALYNWVKRFDLLKFRGKGRNLASTAGRRPKSAMQEKTESMRRSRMKEIRNRKKAAQRGMGRKK